MKRVLLIGKRAAVLTKLQAALRDIGVDADLTQDVTNADRHRLAEYSAVAFGRAVGSADRARMKTAFQAANPSVVFVDGLAPITPLLVAQFEEALDRRSAAERRIGKVTATPHHIEFELRSRAPVRITVFRLTWWYSTRTERLLDGLLDAGVHQVDVRSGAPWISAIFAVVRADTDEVRVIPVRQ